MALIGSYSQQPADKLDYDIDYSEWLVTGDSLLSATVTVDPVGLTVDHIIVGKKIKVWAYGGTNLVKYKITVTATTSLGRIKQDEIKLSIKDI